MLVSLSNRLITKVIPELLKETYLHIVNDYETTNLVKYQTKNKMIPEPIEY